jgi:hypothetical protein
VKTIFAFTLSIFLCLSARAELKWEQTTIELNPATGDKQAIGHFKYQNVGKTPVRFRSVRSSCGCTVAQSQKKEAQPGDRGEITATFNIGGRTGTQIKTITVETDDPAQRVIALTLKTVIGQALAIQPTFVYWRTGEEAKPKTIIARAGKDVPIGNLDVDSSSPEFLTKVERGSAPGEFHINVQPRQTTKPVTAVLTIKTDYPKESPKVFTVTARVAGTSVPK